MVFIMPQFDKLTFFSQIFYFCLIFSTYYFYMSHKYAHVFFLYTKLRNKKKNYHLNLKQFSVLLLNYLQNALKKSSTLINNLGTQSENFGINFLTVFNVSLKNNAFLINKNISLHNISLTEETLNNLSKTNKMLKHKTRKKRNEK